MIGILGRTLKITKESHPKLSGFYNTGFP